MSIDTPRAPAPAHAAAGQALAGLPEHRRELFAVRLDRWWADLHAGLAAAYGQPAAGDLALRVVRLAAAAYRARDPELHRLDQARTLEPDWFQSPRMLGYAAYADRFAGDLAGVRQRIPYLQELGVTYLHLMPLLRPREGENDGGYAVADYRSVRPDLGDVEGLRDLARALRAAGISLVLDLVLNHVAREHEWAAAARAGDAARRAYFHVFDDRSRPDEYEETLPEVFPDFAPGNFTWDEELRGWVWTTFNCWQWDVDWSNPDVFCEYADIVLFLANLGVEVLRLDAIAFLWKRLGTDCQNQPEVHALTQALRAVVRIACPAVAFKAEAIVGPADLVHYLGRGVHYGKVSDLAYHNSLMVQVWSMLAAQDVRLAAHALRALPPIPASTAWVTYVRCHDDIGWAIDDGDAAAVGLSGPAHRAFLSDWYSGEFPGSPARGLVFQHNPATGDRRISGMAAGLVGLEAAREQGGTAAVDAALGRLWLAYAVVLGWGGVPVVWMGDELALPSDPEWAREEGHGGDNRWAHRPRMPWATAYQRHDPGGVEGRAFAGLARLARVRRSLPHLHASVPAEVLQPVGPGVLPVLRRHPEGPLLGLYNVTPDWQPWPAAHLAELGFVRPADAISGSPIQVTEGQAWLPPYAAWWVVEG
ncbi:alpha-amylase family protein [Motilibacter aurantiacus]|uniref:alpha-amylase family protein n=1 Tax=Motilibacter aurantiacus TaxID=2714955 RepID=UPI00140ADF6D|nr:alpha-amylase family protein [Motilibacter aurantiacus]NHC46256.1 alpha-amylase [Motilibacter aurantiacus]